MKVLVITNMFPTQELPYYGIFVKEQVDELERQLGKVNIDTLFLSEKKALKTEKKP